MTSEGDASSAEDRVALRSAPVSSSASSRPKTKPTACRRCHSRKVRCSGGQPCENCRQASKGIECTYPRRNRMVKVSQRYIDDLIAENQRLKSNDSIGSQPRAANLLPDIAVVAPVKETADSNATAIPAPSLDERPWFFDMNIPHTPILIGEASDAAFATRFRQAISSAESSHIPRVNYATDERLLALSDTDCPWPSPARARFLVGVALRYVSRCYHIIRKSSILDALEQTLQNPAESDSLLKSKLWAMFAIGAMYSTRSATSEKHFPGMGYFARATRILRISFYSLALNRRHTAYTFAGSATRLAVVMGLHLNVPESQLRDAAAREHRVRVWWTAYIFDRMWAAKLSHPVAVQDIDIEVDLPSNPVVDDNIADDFADASYFVASVKLAGLLGKVVPSIYRRRAQDTSLSHRVQEALKDLRGWSAELPPQLHIDSKPTSERMPKPISLHLNFNQCAISTTRPILLHVLRTHVASWGTPETPEPRVPATAMTLAETCIRCARHTCRLLTECWIDGSFATFDYFYTQYLFSAATILAASSLLSGKESHNDREQFEEAAQFLSQLKDNGNYAAEEFCHHIDAMKPTMAAAHIRRGDFAMAADSTALLNDTTAAFTDAAVSLNQPFAEQNTTAGMALNEPSLQELLAQPLLDLQFIDASIYHDGAQGLYWPDFSPESWTPETWTAT
ncbi:fungal-specific transcription factor domain-containing protein [Colletotrichum phormii]|uniref:Fungal-specific transcription factor domain-containing protein n=1 Tax=Colletotrichum phormii TaxID=359342 RepID=A0AAJ0EEX5_9PEZI|nr:fungal-specific transcription factor domain-containing protein [Colletotrichum phormii]KAK1634526.1 fungal-specific transcription factor domain-containing protein [Colletotrichum phormii]